MLIKRGLRALGYLTAQAGVGLAALLGYPVGGWLARRTAAFLGRSVELPSRRGRGKLVVHAITGLLALAVALGPMLVYSWAVCVATAAYVYRGDISASHPMISFVGVVLLVIPAVPLTLLFSWPLAHAHARLNLALLAPSAADLTKRVDILTATRSDALDAHGAELRRIERDLHDGTQAQLVALSMRLGLAEQRLTHDPETAHLLREARTGAEDAMTELRGVIRTMYPPILADRGLAGAISGIAARSIIPVDVRAEELGELPAPVEAAAYFVVAESVTNAIKHSHATQLLVHLDRDRDGLHVQVTDDGLGGVDETQGTGIVGIHRRVAALDGTTTVDSPLGAGTTITVELPCRA